ncbi:hypothetical protein ACF9IK_00465 [Kitasatospora hibisci]|uniref:hypothetical protein n=1 Tax=Kitasatospora hibisci TaxID=3369522 RepID=UPI0037553EF5
MRRTRSPRSTAGADPLLPLTALAATDGDLGFLFQYHAGSVPPAGPPDPDPTAPDPLASRLALRLTEHR